MTRLALAGYSVRVLAELAALEGHEVVALDLFGDRDTRRAADDWLRIGDPASLRIDAEALLAALEALRGQGVDGWIAGSGFDGRTDLLAAGAQCLPLIGNDAATVARVRDPGAFFAALDAAGIAHPPVRRDWPADREGWLVKDAAGSGGTHIVAAPRHSLRALSATAYLQRERPGMPMSATFVADGRDAVVLGCNEQIVQERHGWRFLYSGVVGPVPVSVAVLDAATHAVCSLVAAFGLRGLGSLDFLLEGDALEVLELNARPPASVALYPQVGELGPIETHRRACCGDGLPVVRRAADTVRGSEIVFARAPLRLVERQLVWLALQPDVHDLPDVPWAWSPGEPICSVGAQGASAAAVRDKLARRSDALLTSLETLA